MKAIVQEIIQNGKHGSYVVATSEEIRGSVTFSLEPTVWQEKEPPEEGIVVFLNKLRMKRAGWRAKEARFWKPCDEQKEGALSMKIQGKIERVGCDLRKAHPSVLDVDYERVLPFKIIPEEGTPLIVQIAGEKLPHLQKTIYQGGQVGIRENFTYAMRVNPLQGKIRNICIDDSHIACSMLCVNQESVKGIFSDCHVEIFYSRQENLEKLNVPGYEYRMKVWDRRGGGDRFSTEILTPEAYHRLKEQEDWR